MKPITKGTKVWVEGTVTDAWEGDGTNVGAAWVSIQGQAPDGGSDVMVCISTEELLRAFRDVDWW